MDAMRAVRILIALIITGGTAAAASLLYNVPGGFTCPPTNLMGAGASAARVSCGSQGALAIAVENETSTAVYLCGNNLGDAGITPAQVATSCPKRCTTCNGGTVYSPDIVAGQLYCASAGADAGVVVNVTCAK